MPAQHHRSQPGALNRTRCSGHGPGEQAGWDRESLPERQGAWGKNEEGKKGFWIKGAFFKEQPHPTSVAVPAQWPSPAGQLPASEVLKPIVLLLRPLSTAGNTGLGFFWSQTVSSLREGPVSLCPPVPSTELQPEREELWLCCRSLVPQDRMGQHGRAGARSSATPARGRGQGGGGGRGLRGA